MERLNGNIFFALLVLFLSMAAAVVGAATTDKDWVLIDGIAATIDGNPVLRSDVLMEKDFGLLGKVDGSSGFAELLEPYLNRLLIMRELEDIGGFRLSEGQAEESFAKFLDGSGGRAEFEEKLSFWGATEEEIFGRFTQALLASLYTESRLKFLVKIIPSDIEKAYAEDPGRWGDSGIFEAWERIKQDLAEESLEVERERWMTSLRKRYHLIISNGEGEPPQ